MSVPAAGTYRVPRATISDRIVRSSTLAYDVALVVLGAALIAASATVSIQLPDNPVPITGQTFGVLLTAGALGGRRGAAAALLYVAVGVIGLPAFAEGRGGLGVIASVDGGQLVLGRPVATWSGSSSRRGSSGVCPRAAGIAVCGAPWRRC